MGIVLFKDMSADELRGWIDAGTEADRRWEARKQSGKPSYMKENVGEYQRMRYFKML